MPFCNGTNQMKMRCIGTEGIYDPRRAMAIRRLEGDLRLAIRLLQWANPILK